MRHSFLFWNGNVYFTDTTPIVKNQWRRLPIEEIATMEITKWQETNSSFSGDEKQTQPNKRKQVQQLQEDSKHTRNFGKKVLNHNFVEDSKIILPNDLTPTISYQICEFFPESSFIRNAKVPSNPFSAITRDRTVYITSKHRSAPLFLQNSILQVPDHINPHFNDLPFIPYRTVQTMNPKSPNNCVLSAITILRLGSIFSYQGLGYPESESEITDLLLCNPLSSLELQRKLIKHEKLEGKDLQTVATILQITFIIFEKINDQIEVLIIEPTFPINVLTDRFPTIRDFIQREPLSVTNNQDTYRRLRKIYLEVDSSMQHCQLIIDQSQFNLLVNWTAPMSLVFENSTLDPFFPSEFTLPRLPYVDSYPTLGSSKKAALCLQEGLSGLESPSTKRPLKRITSADISTENILNPAYSTSSRLKRNASLIANAANIHKDTFTTIPEDRRLKSLENPKNQHKTMIEESAFFNLQTQCTKNGFYIITIPTNDSHEKDTTTPLSNIGKQEKLENKCLLGAILKVKSLFPFLPWCSEIPETMQELLIHFTTKARDTTFLSSLWLEMHNKNSCVVMESAGASLVRKYRQSPYGLPPPTDYFLHFIKTFTKYKEAQPTDI